MKKIEYALIYFIVTIVRLLPLSLARRFADGLAYLIRDLLGIRRETTIENIQRAFPDWSHEQYGTVTRNCYRHFARAGVDWIKMRDVLEQETMEKRGFDLLEKYRGRGGILAGGHFGYWELSAVIIAQKLGKITVYADQQANPGSERLITRLRKRRNIETVTGANGARNLAKRAKSGEIVGIVGDQRPRNQPVKAPFFGYEVLNTRVLPFVARHSNSPVFPGLAYRTGKKIIVEINEPLPTSLADMTRDNSRQLVTEYNEFLEKRITAHPEQYFWLHNRFKYAEPVETENSP